MVRRTLWSAAVLVCAASVGCGAGRAQYSSAPASAAAGADQAAPPPLDRSLFSRSPSGQLDEDRLQAILARPLEVELPARVGVLAIEAPADWRGPGPSYERASAGLGAFSAELPRGEAFTLVTEMMPIPSGALGMEALRETAARYKLRYLILYRESLRQRERSNAWAMGYATVVGLFFLPGTTLEVDGYIEATMFDVKTGLLMFTVRRRVSASRNSNVWHQDDKLERMRTTLAVRAGADLANDLRSSLSQFEAATRAESPVRAARMASPSGPLGAEAAQ